MTLAWVNECPQVNRETCLTRVQLVVLQPPNLKQWVFGTARFLLRQLEGARAEMALAVNAYNLKRAMRTRSPPVDGANVLKGLFSAVAHTKTNAPNKSGRLLGWPSVRFHTV